MRRRRRQEGKRRNWVTLYTHKSSSARRKRGKEKEKEKETKKVFKSNVPLERYVRKNRDDVLAPLARKKREEAEEYRQDQTKQKESNSKKKNFPRQSLAFFRRVSDEKK